MRTMDHDINPSAFGSTGSSMAPQSEHPNKQRTDENVNYIEGDISNNRDAGDTEVNTRLETSGYRTGGPVQQAEQESVRSLKKERVSIADEE